MYIYLYIVNKKIAPSVRKNLRGTCYLCVYFRITIYYFNDFGFSHTKILYASSRALLCVF